MVPGPGGVGRGHHTNNHISFREKKIRLTNKIKKNNRIVPPT